MLTAATGAVTFSAGREEVRKGDGCHAFCEAFSVCWLIGAHGVVPDEYGDVRERGGGGGTNEVADAGVVDTHAGCGGGGTNDARLPSTGAADADDLGGSP